MVAIDDDDDDDEDSTWWGSNSNSVKSNLIRCPGVVEKIQTHS